MRSLLSGQYIPFGSQYYRAPSPPPEDWETDLRNFARNGFTMVKYWVQWRWNNPEEGEFYFDDIDRLMDLASKNRLKVMLNTIVDVAPAWIYRQYPDASMITLDGRQAGPQTQPHRQIGGLGVCFNHQKAMQHLFRFIEVTVKRYRGHAALEIWNVGSEPELTSSMAELRRYADDAERIGDMLCYCERCRPLFRKWLAKKYGSIGKLNESWNRNYASFDEAEIPRTRNTFNDMIDWRMFFVHTLGEHLKRRFEIARETDRGEHPLMCHHVFIQGFPVTSTANDPWNAGRYGDLHGFTQMDDPMMPDVLRSCSKGKPVIAAEMLMHFGYTLRVPEPAGMPAMKRFIFTGVAANLKGFLFWQYRPELLGREAPAWGLTSLDGSKTPSLEAFAEVNRVVQKNAAFLLDAAPPKAQIALVYNPENEIFAWAATGTERTATDSLLGMHRALYEHNFSIDFIHPTEIENGILRNYTVVVVPFPYVLSKPICAAFKLWVRAGGVLIGESYFGGWDIERGRHATVIPGYGMHEVFRVRQASVRPPGEKGIVRMETTVGLPHISKGADVFGSVVQEVLAPRGASVLARFDSGEPAVTISNYGKGKAVLIGSYVGLTYHRKGFAGNGDFIAGLVDRAARIGRPSLARGSKIRVDILQTARRQYMMILRNLEEGPVTDSVIAPIRGVAEMTEQFSGEKLKLRPDTNGSRAAVELQPQEVRVYRA